jgi:hypothetical protein
VSSQTEMTYVNKITNAIKRNKSFHYRLWNKTSSNLCTQFVRVEVRKAIAT